MGKRARIMKQLKQDSRESPLSVDKEVSKMSMQVANVGDIDNIDNGESNGDMILEKAMQRRKHANDGVLMMNDKRETNGSELKKKKKRKTKKKRKIELSSKVDDMKEEEKAESEIDDTPASTNPVNSSDNSVFRTLLCGPRYFDPPDSSWGRCYNCGEEGHTAINCTAPRRLKPCFVCGRFDHNAKNCAKGKDCYICKKGGHIAKDCPEKNRGETHIAKICLKCGDAGHDMFSCRSSYCTDNLKEIQCYVCQKFGHLCCVDYTDRGPAELSCYRCGQLGHIGLACTGLRTETPGAGSLSSCYRCGEEGHFARECTNSTKVGKRNREHATPKKNKHKENGWEARSVPNDLGKAYKKKKFHHDGDFASASESKHGWLGQQGSRRISGTWGVVWFFL